MDSRAKIAVVFGAFILLILGVVAGTVILPGSGGNGGADLIVIGARAWTGDADEPWAEAVAVRGDRIIAVGSAAAIRRHRGAGTRMVEMRNNFIVPGFIDNHTHFDQAGALILGVNLLDVADEAGLVQRVREARDRLPEGTWLLGGEWGAYEDWAMGATGREGDAAATAAFSPVRSMLDSITPATPVLLNRWDRSAYLANGHALALAGADCAWPGVECVGGVPTGRLNAQAAARIRRVVPPKPLEQRLTESRAALAQLREWGVTGFHDITSAAQMVVYQELLARGELTSRVYIRPDFSRWQDLAALGIRHGFGNEFIKIGGLKGYVDGIMGNSGARFYEPYDHSGERGIWRDHMSPPGNMERMVRGADAAGNWAQIHAIGDEGIDTLIDIYERVINQNPDVDRRFRVIHTQVLRGAEVADRMARLGLIAEMQPYHTIDDMRWMEQRIGARSRWAYAFKTLHDAGVLLSFGSDWPGTNASLYPADPMLGIYAAVTRQTLDGEPAGGWFPEERIDVETALRAYTINNAFAAGEERIKGSLTAGKLADIVVLDRDPFAVDPLELKDIKVLVTILGGEIIHDARQIAAATGN
jgi:predicted amidohydrolase YtcJ